MLLAGLERVWIIQKSIVLIGVYRTDELQAVNLPHECHAAATVVAMTASSGLRIYRRAYVFLVFLGFWFWINTAVFGYLVTAPLHIIYYHI